MTDASPICSISRGGPSITGHTEPADHTTAGPSTSGRDITVCPAGTGSPDAPTQLQLTNPDGTLAAMKAVYTYFFPEVRPIVERAAHLGDALYLTTTNPNQAAAALAELRLEPPLDIPVTAAGHVDLDAMHVPILERLVAAYEPQAPGLSSFAFRYPLSGSSPGIFHLLADLAARGESTIRVLDGEYEGFSEYARHVGLNVETVTPDTPGWLDGPPTWWFISNPSARDGNIIDDTLISCIADAGHHIALDLAYLGTTDSHTFDLNNPAVEAAFISLSKPYGLFRFRVGFMVARRPIESLYATCWFKDIGRLLMGLAVVEALPPGTLAGRYKKAQATIVAELNRQLGLGATSADVFLLASVPAEASSGPAGPLISCFERSGGHRLCLTPYLEQLEKAGW